MAVSWDFIDVLEEYQIFGPGKALLDIGTSNLYNAPLEKLSAFFSRYGCPPSKAFQEYAALLAEGSGRGAGGAALNRTWLGQPLEAIGMHYNSIDIAIGYKTRVLDLNRQQLPDDMAAKFDVVLNCGTTEHILNQFNAFKVIHEATKIGGLIVHQLPATGHTDHGYYTYTSRFFFDLAGFNNYELVDFWFDGPDGSDKMFAGAKSYVDAFPVMKGILDRIGLRSKETAVDKVDIPNVAITVLFRKREERPFLGMMETSTSFGPGGSSDVAKGVLGHYR